MLVGAYGRIGAENHTIGEINHLNTGLPGRQLVLV